jgi:hypothetical protein
VLTGSLWSFLFVPMLPLPFQDQIVPFFILSLQIYSTDTNISSQ